MTTSILDSIDTFSFSNDVVEIFKEIPSYFKMKRDVVEDLNEDNEYLIEYGRIIIQEKCKDKTEEEVYEILNKLKYQINKIKVFMVHHKHKYEENEYFIEARLVIDIYSIVIEQAYIMYDLFYKK